MMSGMEFEARRKALVGSLKRRSYIRTEKVERAMLNVPREIFLPEAIISQAYVDSPQPIHNGQTISAPHMVAIMAELLDVCDGMKVLEVGGGSGYHAAVISQLVGERGHVWSIEWHGPLAEWARENIARAGLSRRVTVMHGDGSLGLPEKAPFDRIFVACGAPEIPSPLIAQLSEGGIILVPVGRGIQDLVLGRKVDGRLRREDHGGCVFVPMVGAHGFARGW